MLRKLFFRKLNRFLEEHGAFADDAHSPGGHFGKKILGFIGLEEADETVWEEDCLEAPKFLFRDDDDLERFIRNERESAFSERLFFYAGQKGMTDVQVYQRAGIDRRHFSKLRRREYHPGRDTAILLGLALRLNLQELEDLLDAAGYRLSKSNVSDLIIEFCVAHRVYRVADVNLALDRFCQKPLGNQSSPT